MFITALFIIATAWKQPRCPSADKWIRKLWYIYTMEYYSAIKKSHVHGLYRLLCPWDSPDKNTGVSSRSLRQGIFQTHGLNSGLPHSRQILIHCTTRKILLFCFKYDLGFPCGLAGKECACIHLIRTDSNVFFLMAE